MILEKEYDMIKRALRAQRFRLIIVQYNHISLLTQLKEQLMSDYSKRKIHQLDGRTDTIEDVINYLREPQEGLLFLDYVNVFLDDKRFSFSLNQIRDRISKYPLGIVLLMPSGGDYQKRLSESMPDLWSIRNLVAELKLPLMKLFEGTFYTDEGKSYEVLKTKMEIDREIEYLNKRIKSLNKLLANQDLLIVLYCRLGDLNMELRYYNESANIYEIAKRLSDQIIENRAQNL